MIYITLDSFRCHTETDEVGADEPYMIVASVDLLNKIDVPVAGTSVPVSIPASRVYLYGPFGDVDEQENHSVPFQSFWGLLPNEERALPNPNDAIFLVGLMENDNGNPENLRGIVSGIISGTLSTTLGADRATRVARLLQDMNSALSTITGAPNFDDRIGFPQELRFTTDDINLAETGEPARQLLRFTGDGGDYSLFFVARNRGQAAWRFCVKCRSLFFDGFRDNKGVCPAGGSHQAAGFTFFIPHDQVRPNFERFWHFCDRCFAMFKPGTGLGSSPGDPGVCPAGSGGHRAQGFKFLLPLSNPGHGQDEWTRCGRCRSLFFDAEANKGICSAGSGGHSRSQTLSGAPGVSFKLDFEP